MRPLVVVLFAPHGDLDATAIETVSRCIGAFYCRVEPAWTDNAQPDDGVRFCSSIAAAEPCRGRAKVQYSFMDLGPSVVRVLS